MKESGKNDDIKKSSKNKTPKPSQKDFITFNKKKGQIILENLGKKINMKNKTQINLTKSTILNIFSTKIPC